MTFLFNKRPNESQNVTARSSLEVRLFNLFISQMKKLRPTHIKNLPRITQLVLMEKRKVDSYLLSPS